MSKPLDNTYALHGIIIELLEVLYRVGYIAQQNKQPDLSALCAYTIFDIIDYGRRHMLIHEDVMQFKMHQLTNIDDFEKITAENFLHNRCLG